jgi:hypothetical protein
VSTQAAARESSEADFGGLFDGLQETGSYPDFAFASVREERASLIYNLLNT